MPSPSGNAVSNRPCTCCRQHGPELPDQFSTAALTHLSSAPRARSSSPASVPSEPAAVNVRALRFVDMWAYSLASHSAADSAPVALLLSIVSVAVSVVSVIVTIPVAQGRFGVSG